MKNTARREGFMRAVTPHVEFHQNRYARALAEVVKPGSRWLDIGAGTRIHGGWVGVRQEQLAGRPSLLVGCDFVVEHLRENPFLHAALAADGGALPFANESFDVISANMVLEHLDRPERVFAEARRVLAPGGCFVFVTPNAGHPVVAGFNRLPRATRRSLAARLEGREEEHVFPTFYMANSRSKIRDLARKAGLIPEVAEAFASFPMTLRKSLPFFAAELALIMISRGPLRGLSSNLVGVLRRPFDAAGQKT
jgi:ubiquinone/menaquinone biosynthesis C-methylase UbiE